MRDQENVMQVDPVEVVPQLRICVDEVAGVTQPVTDVVHQHIHPTMTLQHRSRQVGDLTGVADVGHRRERRPARSRDLLGGQLSELGVDIGDDHLGAVVSEQPRGRRADAATTAGHHRDPVVQQSAHKRQDA